MASLKVVSSSASRAALASAAALASCSKSSARAASPWLHKDHASANSLKTAVCQQCVCVCVRAVVSSPTKSSQFIRFSLTNLPPPVGLTGPPRHRPGTRRRTRPSQGTWACSRMRCEPFESVDNVHMQAWGHPKRRAAQSHELSQKECRLSAASKLSDLRSICLEQPALQDAP
eukprot:2108457-Amphidinium_carterae.1